MTSKLEIIQVDRELHLDLAPLEKGGAGSGNHGHAGRPGVKGGSAPGGGSGGGAGMTGGVAGGGSGSSGPNFAAGLPGVIMDGNVGTHSRMGVQITTSAPVVENGIVTQDVVGPSGQTGARISTPASMQDSGYGEWTVLDHRGNQEHFTTYVQAYNYAVGAAVDI